MSTNGVVHIERTVFINDIHIPYQSEPALNVALKLINYIQPTTLFINGDAIDFYQLSQFDKDPKRALELQKDLDLLESKLFQPLRDVIPDTEIVLKEGNHCNRLQKWLRKHPEVAGLRGLQPAELMNLGKYRIRWSPQNEILRHHGFVVTHGRVVRKHSGYSARAEAEKWGASGISGHTHRAGMYRHSNLGGDFAWYENGCLCDLNPEYIEGLPDWHHCIAVGQFVATTQRFQVDLVHISDGRAVWDGRLFEG